MHGENYYCYYCHGKLIKTFFYLVQKKHYQSRRRGSLIKNATRQTVDSNAESLPGDDWIVWWREMHKA